MKFSIYGTIILLIEIILLIIFEILHLNNATKAISSKQPLFLTFPSTFNQFKYYVWRNAIQNTDLSLSSVICALNYLDIEFYSFDSKKIYEKGFLFFMLTFFITAIWHLFDDLSLDKNYKIIIDFLMVYLGYKIITFKNIFSNKEKELLTFKQFLMRLKFELE